jgi:hypothetical protein
MLVLVYRMRGEWNLLDFLSFRHPFRCGNPVGTRCNMAEQLPLGKLARRRGSAAHRIRSIGTTGMVQLKELFAWHLNMFSLRFSNVCRFLPMFSPRIA